MIVMNPPYRANQSNSNDNAQNARNILQSTRELRRRREAIHRQPKGRALRLVLSCVALGIGSSRQGRRDCFVSNSAFIDSATANGVRRALLENEAMFSSTTCEAGFAARVVTSRG